MEFREYLHIERYGNTEVQGIELGELYIFPKLDGTNASVWMDSGAIQAGSRKRHLSLEKDNAGFLHHILGDTEIYNFLKDHNTIRLYGEFLVPHSLKTYREDAWRKFYIFDVYDEISQKYMPYHDYAPALANYDLDCIHPITVMKNATYDNLLCELDNNTFLIQDGQGIGEGIVLKNYDYINKFGRACFGKIITNSFKEEHVKVMGANYKDMKEMVEQEIVDTYIDKHLCHKSYAKICNEDEGWNSKSIPKLFGLVWYDLIQEEIWNAIKKFKKPIINFKTLYSLMIIKIKQVLPEIF